MRTPTNRAPTPPGEMLLEEFMKPLGINQTQLAARIRVSRIRLNQIIKGRRSITPSTALRLAKVFSTTPEFWLNGQQAYDLYQTYQDQKSELDHIAPLSA